MSDFPAPAHIRGQSESRQSWRELQALPEKPAWWQDYQVIRAQFPHFHNWRIWVYIAWAGQPAATRRPKTIEELAPQVLGCSSRVVRKWRERAWGDLPTVDEAIAWVQAAPLLRHRRDIYEAMVAVATSHDAKGHNDRKMALEMLGDYRPRGVGDPDRQERDRLDNWLNELREAA